MAIKRPTQEEIRLASQQLGLNFDESDVQEFTAIIGATLDEYFPILDETPDYLPEVKHQRGHFYHPEPQENPYNAWYVKAQINGAKQGKLAGKTVAIKDNICVAGLPMMNGSSTFEGYVPDIDATVVSRCLEAGATIPGKAHCEYFCYSAGSHSNAAVTIPNPYNHQHTTGGSSSGCAALVAGAEVDMAIGGDQGGSITVPSAFCGLYGLKPTYGLVPYTGAFPVENTLDHLGPMTNSTYDNALLLEVLAGNDGLDPRQCCAKIGHYTQALGAGLEGVRIGVVEEGFGLAHSEQDVDELVRNAANELQALGAEVDKVSIPMHRLGMSIWTGIAIEGAYTQMLQSNALGKGWRGLYHISMQQAHALWRKNSDLFSESYKLGSLIGYYLDNEYRGYYYAKAQNLSRKLQHKYNEALSRCDLLLMPSTPLKAPSLPPQNPSREQALSPGFIPITNTAPFDCTGHPAMSVPCGMSEGLPAGMLLVAKHFDESSIYRVAAAFEQSVNWKKI